MVFVAAGDSSSIPKSCASSKRELDMSKFEGDDDWN